MTEVALTLAFLLLFLACLTFTGVESFRGRPRGFAEVVGAVSAEKFLWSVTDASYSLIFLPATSNLACLNVFFLVGVSKPKRIPSDFFFTLMN